MTTDVAAPSKGVFDGAAVESLLDRAGLPFSRITDNTWRSRLRGAAGTFSFFIHLEERWITFAIIPFAKSPQDQASADALYRRLLQINHAVMLVKFSIDDDLDVILSVEHPRENMDESEFRDAVDALTYYADRHSRELSTLANASA